MLYGFPIEATQENWLHDATCGIVREIHARIAAGVAPDTWPDVVPIAYRDALVSRKGLRERARAYAQVAAAVTAEARLAVESAMESENDIARLLSCEADCESIEDLPALVRGPVSDLFGFSFGLLAHLGVRDRQYRVIFAALKIKLCPFCGTEFFDAPGAPREALDHYLAKSRYPLAATNLRNLVPMGSKCNSRYKRAKDILHAPDGKRRKAFDPYNTLPLTVSLDESIPFSAPDRSTTWRIAFSGPPEEVETWDNIFAIRERYARDILDTEFQGWLKEFRRWCLEKKEVITEFAQVVDAVARYAEYQEANGFDGGRAFLKAAAFRMLERRCRVGDNRVISIVTGLATVQEAL